MNNGGEVVFEGAHLRAVVFGAGQPNLAVTFDHRNPGKVDFGDPRPVKTYMEKGWAVLRLMTRRNDWFINDDTVALEVALSALAQNYRQVRAIGYSMGGYGVFRFAKSLGMEAGIAVSPQVSIAPSVVPYDKRFAGDAPGFDAVLGDLSRYACADMLGLILVDPFHRADIKNAEAIVASFPKVRLVRLGFSGHPASRILRRGDQGGVIRRQLIAPVPDASPIRQAYRECRIQAPEYWRGLAKHSAGKRPKLAKYAKSQRRLIAQ